MTRMLKGLFLRDQVMRSDIVFAVIIVFAPKTSSGTQMPVDFSSVTPAPGAAILSLRRRVGAGIFPSHPAKDRTPDMVQIMFSVSDMVRIS